LSYLFLILVIVIFYLLTRGYKTEQYSTIEPNKTQKLRGNLRDHEAGLLVALMAKVAKADGRVSELEAELLSHTFTDISKVFSNPDEIREELKKIYNEEKNSFDNTLLLAKKYLKLSKWDYLRRVKIMEYLLNLAFIDGEFSKEERMITEDIASALEIRDSDFKNLIKQFEAFYAQRKNQVGMDIKRAYEVLGLEEGVEFGEVKKRYRKLVRQNHPDILMGQGKDSSIIDEATKKLQEINEAYELIKKNLVK